MANGKNVPATIPALGGEASLNRYLAEIKKFPILAPEQEYMLAKRYQQHEDPQAAAQLVSSHLPRSRWAIAAMAFRSAN